MKPETEMPASATYSADSFFGRLKDFMDIIYQPGLHFAFAAFWFLSLQGGFVLLSKENEPWVFSSGTLMGVITLFLVLFYLRAVDEVKDFEYDKQYNPDRPLVAGAVSFKDVYLYWLLAFLIIPLINAAYDQWLAIFIVADMLYALLLIKLEKWLPLMDRNMFFNLVVTYPVSIALSFYTLLLSGLVNDLVVDGYSLLLIGTYILAFLHFEIVRKNLWPVMAEPGEKFYASDIGPIPAALFGFGCGVAAVTGVILLWSPWTASGVGGITGWLPLLALLPAIKALVRFLGNRQKRFNPRKFAVLYLVVFYSTNLLNALAVNSWGIAL